MLVRHVKQVKSSMDLKQAALFYKNRWQWRKDVSEHQGRQVAAADKVKAKKALATSTKKLGAEEPEEVGVAGSESPTNAKQTSGNKGQPKPKFKVGGKTVKTRTAKEEKWHQDQQALSVGFVRHTLDAVHGINDVSAAKVSDAALNLLRQPEISAQDLLDFSRIVKSADAASPAVKQAVDKHKEGFTARQKSLWDDVLAEIKELEARERRGDPVEFSAKFADDTLSVLDLFLGPAGPLFKVGRDFLTEHKEDAKKLAKAAGRLTKSVAARIAVVKKIGRRASVLFDRFLPGIKSGLRKLAEKMRESSSGGLLSKIGGAGAKVLKVGQFIAGSEVAQAALLIGGAGAISLVGGAKEYIGSKVDAIKNSKPVKLAMAVTGGIVKFLTETTGSLVDGALDLGRGLKSFGRNKWDALNLEFEALKEVVSKAWTTTTSPVKEFLSNLQKAIEYLWSWVKGFMPKTNLNVATTAAAGETQYDANGNATGVVAADATVAGAKGDGTSDAGSVKDRVTGVIDSTAIKLHGGATLEGANPAMVRNLLGMASEYKRITGKTIQLNDGKRSNAQQAALYAKFPGKAAPPGQSMHEYGLAIDINSADAEALTQMGLMSKYGFTRPVAGEKWHVEPIAIQNMKASIRKNGAGAETAVASAVSNSQPGVESETAVKSDSAARPVSDVGGKSVATKSVAAGAKQNPVGIVAAKTTNTDKSTAVSGGSNSDTSDVAQYDATGSFTGMLATPTPSVASSASSQTPVAASYERQPSYSRTVQKTIDPREKPAEVAQNTVTQKDAVDVPFYLGDLGLVTFNLGVI